MNRTVDETRHTRGLAKLAELDSEDVEKTVASMGELGRYLVEFGLGEIFSPQRFETSGSRVRRGCDAHSHGP